MTDLKEASDDEISAEIKRRQTSAHNKNVAAHLAEIQKAYEEGRVGDVFREVVNVCTGVYHVKYIIYLR